MSHTDVISKINKGKFLYSAVYSPAQSTFTLYFPGRTVNQIPSQLLCEASSHMLQLMCERLLVHIFTTVYSQALIYTAE